MAMGRPPPKTQLYFGMDVALKLLGREKEASNLRPGECSLIFSRALFPGPLVRATVRIQGGRPLSRTRSGEGGEIATGACRLVAMLYGGFTSASKLTSVRVHGDTSQGGCMRVWTSVCTSSHNVDHR